MKGPARVAAAAGRRLRWLARPDVVVTDDAPPGMVVESDVAVAMSDGTSLRVNVFRPAGDEPVPVVMCAHPYGKDKTPERTRSGRGVSMQNRIFPQPDPIRYSAWTSWEAPDPAFWVARGYAAINADLRGGGTSEGTADLLSDQEARDYYELIEWAAAQPWCTGRIGLCGVSYLAISQYKVAALRPPHLAAICPWEGFSDLYRDFARPGGVLEQGFSLLWSALTDHAARLEGDLRRELRDRPTRDDWYRARTPDLARIEVPALICASFSDHNLHSRGSFEAFRRIGSQRKWLYTHRGGKWSEFYGAHARETQARFFDWVLRGVDNGWAATPPVRLTVHDAGPRPVAVTEETQWPPADLQWRRLQLDAARRSVEETDPAADARASFGLRRGRLTFRHTLIADLDTIGPAALDLAVPLDGCDDAHLLVALRKFRAGREVTFEGSFGFSGDVVTHGWHRLAFRDLDAELSAEQQPVATFESLSPVARGEIVTARIPLLPQATRWRRGDTLVVDVRGSWPFPRNPFTGQFPSGYAASRRGRATVHTGPGHPSGLLLGVRPVA